MKDLQKVYNEWRKTTKEENTWLIEHGDLTMVGSLDCGEACVREDFSNYANLEQEITFDEMLELENNY